MYQCKHAHIENSVNGDADQFNGRLVDHLDAAGPRWTDRHDAAGPDPRRRRRRCYVMQFAPRTHSRSSVRGPSSML